MADMGSDKNAQVCIWVNGKVVVDLCLSSSENYKPDSTTCIFSSGKVIAKVLLARLHNDGLFDYDDKVVTHWPEFGKNGKENITIADVCRHESCLFKIPTKINVQDLLTENVLQNKVGVHFEEAPLIIPEGTIRSYHTIN
mmetsp:Transcript_40418/g.29111  ORF Transcript_40418/g.29111 Transcript_40418/m.29111 type:complete len:140 (-) Transcript_40418:85-504(-)